MKTDHKAITLIELLVAIMIVTMVVGGVFSADIALRRMSDTVATDIQLQMQTSALAEMLRNDVKKVHGDLVDPLSSGVILSLLYFSVCFRHDVQVVGQYTPGIYSDDVWVCYQQIETNVYRCDGLSAATISCNSTSGELVGTLVAGQFTPTFVASTLTGESSFEMTLVNRVNPALPKTGDNPEVVIQIRESPMGF